MTENKTEHKSKIITKYKFLIAFIFFIFSVSIFVYVYRSEIEDKAVRAIISAITNKKDIDYKEIKYSFNRQDKSLIIDIENMVFKKFSITNVALKKFHTEFFLEDVMRGHFTPRNTKINGGTWYILTPSEYSEKEANENRYQSSAPSLAWIKNFLKTVHDSERQLIDINNFRIKSQFLKPTIIEKAKLKVIHNSKDIWEVHGNFTSLHDRERLSSNLLLEYKRKNFIRVKGGLPKIPLSVIIPSLPTKISDMIGDHQNELKLLSTFRINANGNGSIEEMALEIGTLEGTMVIPKHFDKAINFNNANGLIRYFPANRKFIIEKLNIDLEDGENFLFNASIDNNSLLNKKAVFLTEIKNVDIASLNNLWPKTASPIIRQKIFAMLKTGKINTANLRFIITPKWFSPNPQIGENDIYANLDVDLGSVKYSDILPDIEAIKGNIIFSKNKVDFDIKEGRISGANINNVKATIPFIENSYIDISGNTEGSLANHIAFMKPFMKESELYKLLTSASAKVSTTTSLRLNFTDKISYDNLGLKISAKLEELNIKNLLNSQSFPMDINNSNLNLDIDNDIIKANGDLLYNKQKFFLDYEYKLGNIFHNISISSNIGRNFLENYSDYKFIDDQKEAIKSGSINVRTYGKFYPDQQKYEAKLDINARNAELDIKELGYYKPRNKNLDIKSGIFIAGNNIIIDNISSETKDFSFNGFIEFNESGLNQLSILNFLSQNNHFSLNYKTDKNIQFLRVEGNKMNLSHILSKPKYKSQSKKKSASKQSSSLNLENIDYNINLKEALVANDIKFNRLNADIKCGKVCNTITMNVLKDKDYFKMSLSNNAGNIKASSNNLGLILKGFNISKEMSNGVLDVELNTTNKNKYRGTIKISEFRVLENSILFNIIKLTSVTGILNILKEKGVTFTDLEGDIYFNNESKEIMVEDLYANSDVISISAEGTYNLKTGQEDFQGILTPNLYGLNNLISKIPIIGGTDNSFIGISYKIKKDQDKRKISVNPLSIFTPGFIRNIIQW